MTRVARRTVLKASAAMAAPWLVRARAQTRARRVGWLIPWVDPGAPSPRVIAAWERLGWTPETTLQQKARFAAHHMERMPELVDELLRLENVELLLAIGEHAAAAAARATRTVPIVFFNSYLPVECGLVDSYAKPGRNCTGTAWNTGPEVLAKRLEYLRAIAPSARRFVNLGADSRNFTLSGEPLPEYALSAAFPAARALGLDPTHLVVRRIEEVDSVLAEVIAARAEVVGIGGEHFNGAVPRVVDTALRQRWITATPNRSLFDAGLLLYHGPSDADFEYTFERGLQMADRILRGARPGDIPVELPSRQELALNLKTARALGLTLPQSLVLRADRVVE